MRTFETGATRDTDGLKNDYEGFNNPLVEKEYGDYMNKHRVQADGNLRDSDNWQKGMGKSTMMKSLHRHQMDLWALHRGYYVYKRRTPEGEETIYYINKPETIPADYQVVTVEDSLGGIKFNTNGYWLEHIKERSNLNGQ